MAESKSLIDRAGWTLERALPLVQRLAPKVRTQGFHLCLGGGVLHRGESDKDLDLFVLLLQGKDEIPQTRGLLTIFTALWGEGVPINGIDYPEGAFEFRHRLRYHKLGRTIEVFIQ